MACARTASTRCHAPAHAIRGGMAGSRSAGSQPSASSDPDRSAAGTSVCFGSTDVSEARYREPARGHLHGDRPYGGVEAVGAGSPTAAQQHARRDGGVSAERHLGLGAVVPDGVHVATRRSEEGRLRVPHPRRDGKHLGPGGECLAHPNPGGIATGGIVGERREPRQGGGTARRCLHKRSDPETPDLGVEPINTRILIRFRGRVQTA